MFKALKTLHPGGIRTYEALRDLRHFYLFAFLCQCFLEEFASSTIAAASLLSTLLIALDQGSILQNFTSAENFSYLYINLHLQILEEFLIWVQI
jgi:hypothetical protein